MIGKFVSVAALSGAFFLGVSTFLAPPATAQDGERRGPSISAPENGMILPNPVTVSLGFSDGPGGPDRDHGDRPPPPPPSASRDGQEPPHHQGPRGRLYLFVDAPLPETGTAVQEDATHLAWPPGQRELVLNLATGPHQLRLVFADQDGRIGRVTQNAINIQVQ